MVEKCAPVQLDFAFRELNTMALFSFLAPVALFILPVSDPKAVRKAAISGAHYVVYSCTLMKTITRENANRLIANHGY